MFRVDSLGDVPDRRVEDDGMSDEEAFGRAALELLVTRHLGPRLIGFELVGRMSIAHNPISVSGADDAMALGLEGLEVRVPLDVVRATLLRLADGFATSGLPAPGGEGD